MEKYNLTEQIKMLKQKKLIKMQKNVNKKYYMEKA